MNVTVLNTVGNCNTVVSIIILQTVTLLCGAYLYCLLIIIVSNMTTKTRAKLVRAVILLLLLLLLLMWCTKLYVTVRNGLTVPPSSLPQRHKTGGYEFDLPQGIWKFPSFLFLLFAFRQPATTLWSYANFFGNRFHRNLSRLTAILKTFLASLKLVRLSLSRFSRKSHIHDKFWQRTPTLNFMKNP